MEELKKYLRMTMPRCGESAESQRCMLETIDFFAKRGLMFHDMGHCWTAAHSTSD